MLIAIAVTVLIAAAIYWQRHARQISSYYELTPYRPGRNFTLHVVRVTKDGMEATGHGARIHFDCSGRPCSENRNWLNLADYVASESPDGHLLVYRETTQKMGESESRVYRIISEESATQ
jgi:hypothetical protein